MPKKQEAESNLADFGSWIWGNLNAHMESNKEVTLLDTPDIKVQAGLDVMALASRKESKIQKSGTFSDLKRLQLGPRGVVLVPASRRRRVLKPNNSRRIMQSEAEYYNSEGEYASNEWDNTNLHGDSLVEMVSVTNNTIFAPNEVTDMLEKQDKN